MTLEWYSHLFIFLLSFRTQKSKSTPHRSSERCWNRKRRSYRYNPVIGFPTVIVVDILLKHFKSFNRDEAKA